MTLVSGSQIALLRATELVWVSEQRYLFKGNDVSAHVTETFPALGGLVRDREPYADWKRNDGEGVDIDDTAYHKMVDDVIEEMKARWKRRERDALGS